MQRALDRWRQTERRPKAVVPTAPPSPELTRSLLDWAARERKSVEASRVQVAEGILAAAQHTLELAALRTEREPLLEDLQTERQARIEAQRRIGLEWVPSHRWVCKAFSLPPRTMCKPVKD
jgi:hypothetical protein